MDEVNVSATVILIMLTIVTPIIIIIAVLIITMPWLVMCSYTAKNSSAAVAGIYIATTVTLIVVAEILALEAMEATPTATCGLRPAESRAASTTTTVVVRISSSYSISRPRSRNKDCLYL